MEDCGCGVAVPACSHVSSMLDLGDRSRYRLLNTFATLFTRLCVIFDRLSRRPCVNLVGGVGKVSEVGQLRFRWFGQALRRRVVLSLAQRLREEGAIKSCWQRRDRFS